MTLEPDFEDFISLLNQHQVEYLVVGGYAMAFHGKPRYTGDLDIWLGHFNYFSFKKNISDNYKQYFSYQLLAMQTASVFHLSFNLKELTLNSEVDYLTFAPLDGRKNL